MRIIHFFLFFLLINGVSAVSCGVSPTNLDFIGNETKQIIIFNPNNFSIKVSYHKLDTLALVDFNETISPKSSQKVLINNLDSKKRTEYLKLYFSNNRSILTGIVVKININNGEWDENYYPVIFETNSSKKKNLKPNFFIGVILIILVNLAGFLIYLLAHSLKLLTGLLE